MMILFNKITLIVLCSLMLALLSCRQAMEKNTPTEGGLNLQKEYNQAGLRL